MGMIQADLELHEFPEALVTPGLALVDHEQASVVSLPPTHPSPNSFRPSSETLRFPNLLFVEWRSPNLFLPVSRYPNHLQCADHCWLLREAIHEVIENAVTVHPSSVSILLEFSSLQNSLII